MSRTLLALLLLLAPAPRSPAGQAAPGPEGTLLVAGMDDDSVWLVDLPTGERRAALRTRIAPHEVAVSADGRRAVVSNYGDQRGPGNLLQLIDVEAGSLTGEIVLEGFERIHGLAYLPGDSLLAATSERTSEVLIVGLSHGGVRRRLPTGGRTPHMLSLGAGWIWVANLGDGTVARIDPSGASAPRVWPAGRSTEGIASTPDGREGWTGSRDGGDVVGVVGETGEVVARITGLSLPYRLAATPDGATIVVSDPDAHELVLVERGTGRIRARVDLAAASAAAGLAAEPSPQGFTLSGDGRWAFVALEAVHRVAVVDLETAAVQQLVRTGAGPDGIAFSPLRVGP